jgi:hypothetical protein
MSFFRIYQYLVPAVLFPASYYFWWRRFDHRHDFVLLAMSMPVVFAYVIPGLGTNWLRLWEFKTRWRLGRFRPHHGFVFGTATSLLAFVCLDARPPSRAGLELFRDGFILGSVLAFWNWLYDVYAIRAGFIVVYNRRYHDRAGPEAVATAYAPVVFGAFGACYGVALALSRYYLLEVGCRECFWWLLIGGSLAGLVVPVLAFVLYSLATEGETGLRTYEGRDDHVEADTTQRSGT